MVHSYEVEMAQKHGIAAAVLVHNIFHWIERNKVHEEHFHDGRYWTYDTIGTLTRQFPEMSESTIKRSLKKLEDDGVLLKGNYNSLPFDRTTWYSLSDESYSVMSKLKNPLGQNDPVSSGQNDTMGGVKMTPPIPNKTIHIYPNKESDKSDSMPHLESVAQQVKEVLVAWNSMADAAGMSQVRKILPESERYRMLRARLAEYGIEDVLHAIENVKAGASYLASQHWFDFGWFVRPNNFPKVLEGKYGKATKDMAKSSQSQGSKPETIVGSETEEERNKVDQMSDKEYEEYFKTTFGGE